MIETDITQLHIRSKIDVKRCEHRLGQDVIEPGGGVDAFQDINDHIGGQVCDHDPDEEGQVQQEQLCLASLHHLFAVPPGGEHSHIRVIQQDVAAHPVTIPGDDAGDDKEQTPQIGTQVDDQGEQDDLPAQVEALEEGACRGLAAAVELHGVVGVAVADDQGVEQEQDGAEQPHLGGHGLEHLGETCHSGVDGGRGTGGGSGLQLVQDGVDGVGGGQRDQEADPAGGQQVDQCGGQHRGDAGGVAVIHQLAGVELELCRCEIHRWYLIVNGWYFLSEYHSTFPFWVQWRAFLTAGGKTGYYYTDIVSKSFRRRKRNCVFSRRRRNKGARIQLWHHANPKKKHMAISPSPP